MKKVLSVLLSLVLMLSIAPMGLFGVTASATTVYTDHSNGFQFTLINSKANIVGYSGSETDLVIPDTVHTEHNMMLSTLLTVLFPSVATLLVSTSLRALKA